MDKKQIRQNINILLAGCPADATNRWSQGITTLILESDAYRYAGVLMAFLSMPGEFDTSLLIERALADGKTVVVPRVNFSDKSMAAVKLSSLSQEMTIDRYGLRNPADNIEFDPNEIDLVIVPGLAFDRHGRRLGRGGGFYDRFLGRPELISALRCGVCFELQLVENIPTAEHDALMNMVVTELQVISGQ